MGSSTIWQRMKLLRWAVPALVRFVFFGRSATFYFSIGEVWGAYQPTFGKPVYVVAKGKKT